MLLLNTTIAFASGIGISLAAAYASYMLQLGKDRRQRREEAAFRVYMLLLELHGFYFWITSAELRGEPPPAEVPPKVCKIAMQIAEKLREADDVEHLEEILIVLMREDAYKTAADRANALNAVIDRMGNALTPRYAEIVRRISDDNVQGLLGRPPGHRNNAPALMF